MASTEDTMYKKRDRNTGMPGQLYETKLVGLALFKLLHDERFEYFYLASNLDEIGCFDDLCFKAKIKGVDRPFLVFIQAKHKEDDNAYVDFDEVKHFHDSYSKVVQKFYLGAQDKKNKDKIFIGNIDDYECVFILYTNGKYKNDSGIEYGSAYAGILNDLISTGRKGTKLHCTDEIVENLTEAVLKVEIEDLAEHFTKFLSPSQSLQMMIDDDVKRYHVVLALNAVNISEIYTDEKKKDLKWRNMTFREDFFTSDDKNLMVLKKAMFRKILRSQAITKNKKPLKDPKLEEQLQKFLGNPCLNTLTPLIGLHIVCKNDKLEFASQRSESEKQALKEINLSQDIIEEAEAIVARDILLSSELKELKVPVTFGNTDLMISEKRITHLAKSIVDLCKKFKLLNGFKVVTLDESVDSGILNINGGLGGTVGNLLIYEESTKLLRFVDDSTSLQNNARLLFEKLESHLVEVPLCEHEPTCQVKFKLTDYRFYVKPMLPFPVLSFDCDSGIAREISNKLIIYAGQSDQKKLEIILKKEIEDYQKAKYPNMQVQAESLFQNYHSNIQTWSLLKTKGPYLTKDSKTYQEAINNIFFEPQMSSLRNTFHMTKMKHIEYSTESLKTLQQLSTQKNEEELNLAEIAIIVSDVAILTAIKVIQYLKHNGVSSYSILDLECLLNLSTEDFCALKLELKKTEKVLLIMCHNLQSGMIWFEKYLKEIAQVVEGKRKIVITNSIFIDMVRNVFSPTDKEKENAKKEMDVDNIIYEKHNLVDLAQESQEDIMKNSNIKFQGQLTTLDLILDETSMPFIEGVILNKIVFNETIEIGELHSDANYDEISHLYQDRTVEYIKCHTIPGRVCTSSIVCVTDVSQTSSSNHSESNQHRDKIVGSTFSVSDSDFGVTENRLSMYFNFEVRIHTEKGSQDAVAFIVVVNEKIVGRVLLKIKNIANKVWYVKVTLFDESMQLRNWLKDDNVLEDTLKALRYLCQGVVLNNVILNEDIDVIRTDDYTNRQIADILVKENELQCYWYKEETYENNAIIHDKGKDCDNNVTTDEVQKYTGNDSTSHIVQENDSNITCSQQGDSDNINNTSHAQKNINYNATVDDALKDATSKNKVEMQINITTTAENNASKDHAHKDSCTNIKDHSEMSFASNITIGDEQKSFNSNAAKNVELKDSSTNVKDDLHTYLNINATAGNIQKDSDNNAIVNSAQKDPDNNITVYDAQKDSDNNLTEEDVQKDSDSNLTVQDVQKDSDSDLTVQDAQKDSNSNLTAHDVHKDSDSNLIVQDAHKDSDSNLTVQDVQKDSDSDLTVQDAQKDSNSNLTAHDVHKDSDSNLIVQDAHKDSDSNLTVDDAQKGSDSNFTVNDTQKDSDNNLTAHDAHKDSDRPLTVQDAQKNSDSNLTVHDAHKDSDNNVTVYDERKVSNNKTIVVDAQKVSDNNATVDGAQKDSNSSSTVNSALKDSDNIVTVDVDGARKDAENNACVKSAQIDSSKDVSSEVPQKDFLSSFRTYLEQTFFLSVPGISFIANNLQDESFIKDKQENINKDNNIAGGNVCLDQSLTKCEDAHDFQIKFHSRHQIELKTFDDLKDDVVLLTAKAGLGKSTILTHLSRKTNKLEKHVWVVRMNLLNYSGEFRKWQRFGNLGINTLTTLSLMVQVIFKNINVYMKEESGKITLENCSGDEWARLNLKMFLNYYNNGNLLFIFDGFDEICPDYKNEVLLFLNVVKNFPCKNKMWITSRPYNAVLPDLEQRFGKSFRLEYLNKTEQTEYLQRFWDKSVSVKNACKEDMESLLCILSVIIVVLDIKLKIICYDFYKYMEAKFPIEYNDEIKLRIEEIEKVYKTISSDLNSEDNEFMGTPLLLHLIAGYFMERVLDFSNLEKIGRVSIINMYEWFIETKLLRILFIDKYGMNIDIPFVKERCAAELKQSLTMYKKFGAQAIFGNPIFVRNGLNFEEFNDLAPFNLSTEDGRTELNAAVNRIYTGKDKTGLITYITDGGTPVFIHKTFAEYFAVEYISDILKNENVSNETKKLVMTVVFSIMLKESVVDDSGKSVSRGSLGNWIREKGNVDEDYKKLAADMVSKEPFLKKYLSVVNTISHDILRVAYIRLVTSSADDYEDPSFKESNLEEYLSGKRQFDKHLLLMMKPHFRKKFPDIFENYVNRNIK